MEVSRSEEIETDETPLFVGADADLIFSPSITFYISQGISISLDWTTCTVSSTAVDTFSSSMNQKVRQLGQHWADAHGAMLRVEMPCNAIVPRPGMLLSWASHVCLSAAGSSLDRTLTLAAAPCST